MHAHVSGQMQNCPGARAKGVDYFATHVHYESGVVAGEMATENPGYMLPEVIPSTYDGEHANPISGGPPQL